MITNPFMGLYGDLRPILYNSKKWSSSGLRGCNYQNYTLRSGFVISKRGVKKWEKVG